MDPEQRIERLERELAEQAANLEKAATIGKGLLEANQELEQRNEELVAECTRQVEVLEQEKYTLQMHLTHKEHMERHQAAEMEGIREGGRLEAERVRERLALEHGRELRVVRTTGEGLQAEVELARIREEQLRGQVKTLETELEKALSRANTTILDVTTSAEDRMAVLQEENITLTSVKGQLTSQLKDASHELERLRFTNHTLSGKNEELESRAAEEHQQCLAYFRSLQETRTQVEELQAELDLLKLESTDPNSKGNSLFAEVEDKRQALEKKLIGIQVRYDAMQKHLNHKRQQVHDLKYQMAGLLQTDQGRAALSQVERLEQLLAQSRTEVRELTQKLHTSQNQQTNDPTPEQLNSATGLKQFYQSKLDQAKKEKERLTKEIQSERWQRMFSEDQLAEGQRKLYSTERQVQQLKARNIMLTLKLTEHGIAIDKEVKGGYKEKVPIPEKYRKKVASEPNRTEAVAAPSQQPAPTSTSSSSSSSSSTNSKMGASTNKEGIAHGKEKEETLREVNANVPSLSRTSAPSAATSASSLVGMATKKKSVSISEAVTVVETGGKRSATDGNNENAAVEEGDSQKRKKKEEEGEEEEEGAVVGDERKEVTVKGRRGRRAGDKDVVHIEVKGDKNECNQQ